MAFKNSVNFLELFILIKGKHSQSPLEVKERVTDLLKVILFTSAVSPMEIHDISKVVLYEKLTSFIFTNTSIHLIRRRNSIAKSFLISLDLSKPSLSGLFQAFL